MKQQYTPHKAAIKLGVTTQAILKAIKSGRLKARKGTIRTKAWLISEDALKNFSVSISHQERGKNS